MLTTSPIPNAQIGAQSSETSQLLRNLQHAIAQCRDAVFITDSAGIIARTNPAFEKLTGYSSHEAVGKDLSALSADGPHSEDYRQIWERVLQQRQFSGSITLRHKSDQRIAVEITVTPVLDTRGQIGNLVCTCSSAEQSDSRVVPIASAAKPEQIKEVAHALNNTLMTAMAQAELSFELLAPEHAVRVRLKGIKYACRRAADLVRLLYELEKQTEKNAPPQPLHFQNPSAPPDEVATPFHSATLKKHATAAG